MFVIVFGINGVGKNSVISKLKIPDLLVLSRSKVLMYQFGIIKSLGQEIGRKEYEKLEQVPLSEINKALSRPDSRIIDIIKNRDLILLSHLVVARFLHDENQFINTVSPFWLEYADGFILIESKAEDILKRREADIEKRRRPLKLSQIQSHLDGERKEWEGIIKTGTPSLKVMNSQDQLLRAVAEVQTFVEFLQ